MLMLSAASLLCLSAGGFASRIHALFFGRPDMRVLMNGLDAAGKVNEQQQPSMQLGASDLGSDTAVFGELMHWYMSSVSARTAPLQTTILYQLKLGEVVTTIPTIGFNVETLQYRNVSFTVWDMGGRDKTRALWKYYQQNTSAIIWVVDSTDRERISQDANKSQWSIETRAELHAMLAEDELRGVPLLVFANKQDLSNAMSVEEVTDALGLRGLRQRPWTVQGCSALTGNGLLSGLEWLSTAVRERGSTAHKPAAAPQQQVAKAFEPPRTSAPAPAPGAPARSGPEGIAVATSAA